jgi:hypothetical protein
MEMLRLTSRLARLAATAAVLAVVLVTLSTSAQAQVRTAAHPSAAAVPAQARSHTYRAVTAHGISRNALRPHGTKVFTIGVKCGWWSGEVQWGGLGIPTDQAYIQVTGTVYSSCNSTTYVHISYREGMASYGPTLFAKTGPYSNAPANFYAQGIGGTYSGIIIQACSNRYGWKCASHTV